MKHMVEIDISTSRNYFDRLTDELVGSQIDVGEGPEFAKLFRDGACAQKRTDKESSCSTVVAVHKSHPPCRQDTCFPENQKLVGV